MKILVTGGAGFIGSHLADRLIEDGHEVVIIDNLSAGRVEYVNPKSKFYKIDMNDAKITSIFNKEKPSVVYHLAFNTDVPRAVRDPLYDIMSLTGSLNVLENSYKSGVSRFIFTSSGFIYGNAGIIPTEETASFQSVSPYAISKFAVEQYLKFYGSSRGLPYVILRLATVYGPRQVGQAMADYIRKLSEGKQAELYGRNKKTRDYVYVMDVIEALLLCLNFKPDESIDPVFNVGTGVETPLRELYSRIAKILSKKDSPIFMPERQGELQRFSLDYSKIKKAMGWKPKYNIDGGLKETLKSKRLI